MQVIRAKTAGFCFGVSHALQLLDKEIESLTKAGWGAGKSPRVITLGPIIHNPLVMDAYAQLGVICTDDIAMIKPGDHVIIRAHGIPIVTEARLKKIGAIIIDATCPKVKKAQNAIAQHHQKTQSTLLLFGEADHPEVQGLISYAGGNALIFDSLETLKTLPLSSSQSYYLAAQTTQDKRQLPDIIDYLQKKITRDIPVLKTICDATKSRQDEVVKLSEKVEAMVVVGGLNSGNTKRLAEIAEACNIPTIHIEDVTSFVPRLLKNVKCVGLTAGASTPKDHIDAMEIILKELDSLDKTP